MHDGIPHGVKAEARVDLLLGGLLLGLGWRGSLLKVGEGCERSQVELVLTLPISKDVLKLLRLLLGPQLLRLGLGRPLLRLRGWPLLGHLLLQRLRWSLLSLLL